ncbi:MAG: bifunctional isocitrate dehydrogenase kinase/phosphatase [Formivibrio sp.]|nr:bifunctional isocitrate dehydrogenase kinase/phosphatase [Formivibrio sp.]
MQDRIVPLGSDLAYQIAQALIDGFDRHYSIFHEYSRQATARFEVRDWQGELLAVRDRVLFYDQRVAETVMLLRTAFNAQSLDDVTWQQVKLMFIGMLINHKQPELAETFFNSVSCRILDRTYFYNDYLFARPAISTAYIVSSPPSYLSYYPQELGMFATVRRILLAVGWHSPFENLEQDIRRILITVRRYLRAWPLAEVNSQIQVLSSPFYRNKSAFLIGKAVNGYQEYPFALAVRHGPRGLYVDALLLEPWRISLLFSLSRAYFMVDMEVPSAYVFFLRTIMPSKPAGEIYTMLGLGKQGKTMFYRDLCSHLKHSNDAFIVAPGVRGMVMAVFTLPSFPYVFKIIKDHAYIKKDMTPAKVMTKYQMVKQVDRVGRMADTLEFSHVALPRERFEPGLLKELREVCAQSLEDDGDRLVVKHVYIERRLTPLNLYEVKADEEQLRYVVREYGDAIREMAQANVFPGDMLSKNFGVTRYGRVVFYDYDEIEYMTDCCFRCIPPAPYPEAEMSAEPWYPVGRMDVFPEEFGRFLLANPLVREIFLTHHADLLTPRFWQETQARIRAGVVEDFFSYPQALRFIRVFGRHPARKID